MASTSARSAPNAHVAPANLTSEIPCDASDPRLAAVQFRPESSFAGGSPRYVLGTAPSSSGYAPAIRPSVVQALAGSNDREASPPQATSVAERATARRPTRRDRGMPKGYPQARGKLRISHRQASPRSPGASWHLVRASRIRCVRAPNHRLPRIGTEVPLPVPGPGHSVRATPPRDRTGRYLGRRSRTWKRSPASRRFETGDPVPSHEPSNWSSANRPGDRRGGSAHLHSSASWSPSDIGGRSRVLQALREGFLLLTGCARRTPPRRSRSRWTTRAAFTRSGSWFTVPATQSM